MVGVSYDELLVAGFGRTGSAFLVSFEEADEDPSTTASSEGGGSPAMGDPNPLDESEAALRPSRPIACPGVTRGPWLVDRPLRSSRLSSSCARFLSSSSPNVHSPCGPPPRIGWPTNDMSSVTSSNRCWQSSSEGESMLAQKVVLCSK